MRRTVRVLSLALLLPSAGAAAAGAPRVVMEEFTVPAVDPGTSRVPSTGHKATPSSLRVSVSTDGGDGDGDSNLAAMSADGRYVAFQSAATNLVAGDVNGEDDVFVRDTCVGAPSGCVPAWRSVGTRAGSRSV